MPRALVLAPGTTALSKLPLPDVGQPPPGAVFKNNSYAVYRFGDTTN